MRDSEINITDDYERAADILKPALEEMKRVAPPLQVAVALADCSMWLVLKDEGAAAGQAIIKRLQEQLDQWIKYNPGMSD
jgi:hypothetical protein